MNIKNGVVFISLCLSDIPKDKIKVSETNDKKYLSLAIKAKKEKDEFGNDIFVVLNPSKEEREAEKERVKNGGNYDDPVYLGSGRFVEYRTNLDAQTMNYIDPSVPDDLPF